jgi:hypothetical protein
MKPVDKVFYETSGTRRTRLDCYYPAFSENLARRDPSWTMRDQVHNVTWLYSGYQAHLEIRKPQ